MAVSSLYPGQDQSGPRELRTAQQHTRQHVRNVAGHGHSYLWRVWLNRRTISDLLAISALLLSSLTGLLKALGLEKVFNRPLKDL